ncbi:hypothetical protein SGPA1_31563 [Streptomyces misionensis JCM 4497]
MGRVRALGRAARLRQPGAGGDGHRHDRGLGRAARRAARAGPGPRHRLSAGGGRAAGPDRAVVRRRRPLGAARAGPHGALADGRDRAGPGDGRHAVRHAGPLARRDGQPPRPAAVRPARGELHRRAGQLVPAPGAVGHAAGRLGVRPVRGGTPAAPGRQTPTAPKALPAA